MAAFNIGHIAEYIFAIAIGAVFKSKSNNKASIAEHYKILKGVLKEEFLKPKNAKNPKIEFRNAEENPSLKISITLGKNQPTNLATESLSHYFNTIDPKVKKLEESALNFAEIFAQEKKNIVKKSKLVEINSEGIVDNLTTKADITIKIDGKVTNYSLKTKSSTVHSTSWNSEKAIEMIKKLFDPKNKNSELKKIKFPEKSDQINQQRKFFSEVVKAISENGKITDKEGFIEGLRNLIGKHGNNDKNSVGFKDFELVKLEGPEKYTTLLFSTQYVNIAKMFDYVVKSEKSSRPKIRVQLKLPDRRAFKANFVDARPKGDKFLLEVGPAINLLSNKYLERFLKEFDSNKLSKNGSNAIYRQLVNTFNNLGLMKDNVLTEKGIYFVDGAKKILKIN